MTTQINAQANKSDFEIMREFSASKEAVFRAFSEPDIFIQWFMPAEMNMQIQAMNCQTGGSFENSHTHTSGMTFGFRGVFHEVEVPAKIIKTSEFVGLPQKMPPVLETTTFETLENGNTKVTIHTLCPSVEFRNAMIQNGMEQHLEMSYQLLDKILIQIS